MGCDSSGEVGCEVVSVFFVLSVLLLPLIVVDFLHSLTVFFLADALDVHGWGCKNSCWWRRSVSAFHFVFVLDVEDVLCH
jgi:hypothetical protein